MSEAGATPRSTEVYRPDGRCAKTVRLYCCPSRPLEGAGVCFVYCMTGKCHQAAFTERLIIVIVRINK